MAEDPGKLEAATGGTCVIDVIELGFILCVLLAASISWVGITLAELHLYRWKPLFLSSVLVSAAGGYFALRSFRGSLAAYKIIPTSSWVYLLAILAAAAVFFFQPGEYLFNGSDGSVYVNTGKMIERTGGITFSERFLDSIPQSLWGELFTRDGNWPNLYNRFEGGVQIAEGKNLILPNFFHLFPVWIATFNLFLGPRGGFYVNSVFGLLSLLALWLLGRRLSSPLAGTLAAGLLLCNFGQLWYARFPTSEILTQFFVLTGLYFTVLCVDGAPPLVGLLAGAAFGLAAFCRIDVLVLVSPLVLAFLGVVALEGRFSRTWGWYLGAFALLTGHAVGHAFLVVTPYTLRVLSINGLLTARSLFGAATLVASGALLWAVLLLRRRYWTWLKSHSLMVSGMALGLLALRLWPHLWSGSLGLLLSPVGVVAAFAGVVVFLTRDATLRSLSVIAVFLGSALFYLESLRATPWFPWALRRYVPVILPLSLLFAGHMTATVLWSRIRLRALIVLVPVMLGALFLAKSWPILRTPPMRGVYAMVEQLAARFPASALVLFDQSIDPHLALSLDYTFARDAVVADRVMDTPQTLHELTAHAFAFDHPVFIAMRGFEGSEGSALLRSALRRFAVRSDGTFLLRYTALESTETVLPRAVRPVDLSLELYQVLPWDDAAARFTLPLRIDVGSLDFPYLLSGFHHREVWGAVTARWTQREAQLLLPPLAAPPGQGRTLVLRAVGSRPPGVEPSRVTLALNGIEVGQFTAATQDFTVYRFPLLARLFAEGRKDGTVLSLRMTTFVPKDVGLNEDPRELGVALDWVAVE